MVRWGMTPMQAIQSATINAATLLNQTNRLGSLEAGHFADIVAVDSDPLKAANLLEKVSFVMKGGIVYKNQINATPR